MSAALEVVYRRSERMVGRRIVDEFVLVPIVSRGADVDSIFNLNKLGTFIWERIDGVASGSDIVAAIAEKFDVDQERAASDYDRFVDQLLSIRALEPVAQPLPMSQATGRRG
jgi:hypothetical protein